jgi:hypothetical protein
MYREGCESPSSALCPSALLDDDFSRAGPGYYEEAVIDQRAVSTGAGSQAVIKKNGTHLLEPDHRVGYPFV